MLVMINILSLGIAVANLSLSVFQYLLVEPIRAMSHHIVSILYCRDVQS